MRIRSGSLSALVLGLVICTPVAIAQDNCDSYLAASRSMASVVTEAFTAISAGDSAAQAKALPRLEAVFGQLPAAEIKPQLCTANINTYTTMQFEELNILRAHGIETGFPKDLPIVKQPRLNHENLAYAVGWIKYEMQDYTGALAAFDKGLKMFPHSPEIQNEYLATLMRLQRYNDVAKEAEKYLSNSYDMTDTMRAKVFQALALAQMNTGDKAGATQSAQVAVYYDSNDSTLETQKQVAGMPK